MTNWGALGVRHIQWAPGMYATPVELEPLSHGLKRPGSNEGRQREGG